MSPRIGSMASGYGGLDMAVTEVLGGRVVWHLEYDAAPSKVLAHHWPGIPNHGDITKTDWTTVEPIDVLTAGYPCQPFSHAGKRRGIEDERHIWPWIADAIRVLQPELCVFENVAGHLGLGFDRVLADLAALGFDAEWGTVRASDVAAPHRRERLFVVASNAHGVRGQVSVGGGSQQSHSLAARARRGEFSAAHADEPGLAQRGGVGGDSRQERATTQRSGDPGTGLALLPTPKASDGPHGGPGMRNGRGEADALPGVVALLPTPTVGDSKAARNSTATRHVLPPTGIHAGDTLTDILVPTGAIYGNAAEARPDQALPDVRGTDDPQAVRQAARGLQQVPEQGDLWAGVRVDEDRGDEGRPALAGASSQGQRVPGVRNDGSTARPSHRPNAVEQRPGQPDNAVRVVPHSAALAGGPGQATRGRCGAKESAEDVRDLRQQVPSPMETPADLLTGMQGRDPQHQDSTRSGVWGPYAPAIRRWEMVLGRPAPNPTEPGKDGRARLSPRAVEWLMGLPEGHVTDPAIGLSRAQQLRCLGNGVVPAQAELALRLLLGLGVAPTLPTLPTLPTPTVSDTNGAGAHGDGGADLRTAVALLPTPACNDMGDGKTPPQWDEWTARMKASHGNGNGHGKSLAIEAMRLADD